MTFKLSLKNIKKSIKDYSLYFFTLVVAVSIFYIFNSLEAQKSILELSNSKEELIKSIITIMNYLSVFVSIILGFLIIYSNNFIIKRRKKEIGLYLTLGMSKRKVSTILTIETIIIGIFSLLVGLLLGIFISQGLSILTAKLFEVNLSNYTFIFSEKAIYKTILYFGLIFILVMIFNIISLLKYKLINLLTANKQNEKVKFRNKYTVTISFIISVILIAYAYHLLFQGKLFMMDNKTLIMILAGSLGTLLFFYSLSGFILTITKQIKKIYYKDLNMFNLKQINNQINTSVISTTIISLMLLLTIGILSCSITLTNAFNNGLNNNNNQDFTIYSINKYLNNEKTDLNKITNNQTFKQEVKEYTKYNIYNIENITTLTIMTKQDKQKIIKKYGNMIELNTPLMIIKQSDYNKIMKVQKKKPINIRENEYIELSNIDTVIEYQSNFYKNKNKININNDYLKPATNKIINQAIENSQGNSNTGIIVINDKYLTNKQPVQTIIIGNYKENNKETREKNLLKSLNTENQYLSIVTKQDMVAQSLGLKVMLIYIGLYLGLIFAISSVTILAITELSTSSDNKERYKILKELGASDKMINKALFTQIAIIFLLPLGVALFHAIFGLTEINSLIKMLADIKVEKSLFLTSTFITLIYGGYFLATYKISKRIIKD